MAESNYNSLQPLSNVAREVEESEKKLNLVNLCIRAQQNLNYKLEKESQRRKEVCSFIRHNNLQLETEIKYADEEIKNMLATYEIMKSANVELKKELLLSKENNLQSIERMKIGEKKYEELWLQSKKRYESIPFVQTWLQTTRKSETLKIDITSSDKEAKTLHKDIKTKKEVLLELDRKQITQLAEFVVHELPRTMRIMKEKFDDISKLTKCIDAIIKEREMKNKKLSVINLPFPIQNVIPPTSENINTKVIDYNWPDMPKLQLTNTELDILNVKLKLNEVVTSETKPVKRSDYVTGFEKSASKRFNKEDELNSAFISSYLNKPFRLNSVDNLKDKTENYSKRKLINILENYKLDDNETYSLIAKVNPVELQQVNIISADTFKANDCVETLKSQQLQTPAPLDSEEIEEIDLTKSNSQNILNPPTQFLDLTQDNLIIRSTQQELELFVNLSMEDVPSKKNYLPQLKGSQESAKKIVSFHFPMTVEEVKTKNTDSSDVNIGNWTSETENTGNQPGEETPLGNDDNFMEIKDMVLKKHNLNDFDLSPQFVYAKKKAHQKINGNDMIVTSKFFHEAHQIGSELHEASEVKSDHQLQNKAIIIDENSVDQSIIQTGESIPVVGTEDKAVTSSKSNEPSNPVAGLLFNHGPQGIPESLDISMSTTGFEDVDGEYPHCLDNSLLMSPKADVQSTSGIAEGNSQELPNFLSGFRKTGLFFFGQKRQDEANPESDAQNQKQTFSFNFNGQENKPKGGLFSFFR